MKAHSPEMIGSRVTRNRNKEQSDKHLNGCSEHEFLCISLRIAGRAAGGDESAQHKNGIHNSDGDQILRNDLAWKCKRKYRTVNSGNGRKNEKLLLEAAHMLVIL